MRPLMLLTLLWSCSSKGDSATTQPATGPSTGTVATGTPTGTTASGVAGLADYAAWLDGVDDHPSCHGSYTPAVLATLADVLDRAQAIAADADADEAARSAIEAELADLLANPPPDIDHREDLAALLDGVSQVTAPGGTPSQLGVVGCNGLAVFQDRPWAGVTVAAGRSGDGRLVVFAKEIGSYLPVLEDASADPEMAALTGNLLTWLLDEDPMMQPGPVPVLVETGFDTLDPTWNLDHVAVADIAAEAALFDPAIHPLAIVNPRIEDPAAGQVLRDYVAAGGALLLGHQVWNWEVDVAESEGQRLLAESGVIWRSWYGTGGGPVAPVDDLFLANTAHLLAWLEEVEGDWPNHAALGFDPAELGEISRFAVDSHGWFPRSERWLLDPVQDRYDALPSPLYPGDLTERPHSMVVVPLLHRILGLEPGQDPGKGVDVFPGPVPANTPTEDRQFTVDFDRPDPAYLATPWLPQERIPTGLYAVPGQDLTVTATPDGTLALDAGLGLRVVIGAHSDDLSDKTTLDRPPLVAFSEMVEPGSTALNNPYGGLIYLEVPRDHLRPGTAEVLIQGAIPAPTWDSSEHIADQWADLLAVSAAPWGDVVGDRMIATLPRYQLEQVADPSVLAAAWDGIVDLEYDLLGLDGGTALDDPPSGRWQYVVDRQISAGWMHSGYPIMAYESADLHLLEEVQSWGPYHELGHNLQQSAWRMADSGEVSNNVFSLYCAEQLGQGSRLADQYTWAAADARLASGDLYRDLDVWEKLTFYRRLSLAYGWDFYRQLGAVTRQRQAALGDALDPGQTAEEYLLVQGSVIAGEDLTGFFDHYGVVVGQAARDEVAAMGLPVPATPLHTLTD